MSFTWHYDSPLGGITLASDGDALTGLWFDGQAHFAETLAAEHREKMLPVFEAACRWLDIYFDGRDPGFTPPLNPSATPFRRRVWDVLLTIPFGQTMTYGEIARRLAEAAGTALGTGAISAKAPGSHRIWPRAVGGAVGHNPISLIIPCHRVIGTAGRLTGYAAGIDKKARLLRLEQSRQ